MGALLSEGLDAVLDYSERDRRRRPPRWRPPSGDEIRAVRTHLGLSQERFAEAFGLNLVSLRKWEQGRAEPEQTTCLLLRMIEADHSGVEQLMEKVRENVAA